MTKSESKPDRFEISRINGLRQIQSIVGWSSGSVRALVADHPRGMSKADPPDTMTMTI